MYHLPPPSPLSIAFFLDKLPLYCTLQAMYIVHVGIIILSHVYRICITVGLTILGHEMECHTLSLTHTDTHTLIMFGQQKHLNIQGNLGSTKSKQYVHLICLMA